MCCILILVLTAGGVIVSALSNVRLSEQAAKSFIRSKRYAEPRCFNKEGWCESNKMSCLTDNEDQREHYCLLSPCPTGQTCYLSTPCPAHYSTGCSATDPCLSMPCFNHGTCNKISGSSYSCSCPKDYDPQTDCKTLFPCLSRTCYNGGTCYITPGESLSVCLCVPGYDPNTDCQTDIDECASSPCVHGKCINQTNLFKCECFSGYFGVHCQYSVAEYAVPIAVSLGLPLCLLLPVTLYLAYKLRNKRNKVKDDVMKNGDEQMQ